MTIYEIFKALESTSSRNEKMAILRENKDNKLLKDILKKTYDPYADYYLKKLPKITEAGSKSVEDSWDEFSSILDKLEKREITGNEARDVVVNFMKTVNEEAQYIYKYVLNRKFTKAGVNKRTINKIWPGLVEKFQPQLANKYTVTKIPKYPDHFYWSTKLDGIRCIYMRDKDKLLSRNGKEIEILTDIKNSCRQICEDFNLEFVDGELFSTKFDFNTIQSAVMSRKNLKPELLQYIKLNVFAVGDHLKDTEELAKTLQEIKKRQYDKINIVDQIRIEHNINLLVKKTIEMLQMGFEGIMLRHPVNYYSWDRSDNLLKMKEFQLREILKTIPDQLDDETRAELEAFLSGRNIELSDFTIIDLEEGTGNFAGMLGAFVIQGEVDGRTITSHVGSGLKLDERIKYWQMKDELIGKEVEVVCQEITKDNSLRFPIIKAVKLDR